MWVSGVRSLLVLVLSTSFGVARADSPGVAECQRELLKNPLIVPARIAEELRELHRTLPETFGLEIKEKPWFKLLENYVLPALNSPDLLLTTLIGMGGSQKSTIFSSIEGAFVKDPRLRLEDRWSESGIFGGTTRRTVYLMREPTADIFSDVSRICGRTVGWQKGLAETEGDPLMAFTPHLPARLLFADSPGLAVFDSDDARAAEAMRTSDVLFLTTKSPPEIKRPEYRNRLKALFERYGRRPIIIVLSNVPKSAMAAARPVLVDFANDIYGVEGKAFPDGVLGVYLMPYDEDVFDGTAPAELHPFRKDGRELFPQFGELITQMHEKRTEIKDFGVVHAIEVISREVAALVRPIVLSHLTTQLYVAAAPALGQEALKNANFDFPGERYVKLVRKHSKHYAGLIGKLELGYDYIARTPGRITAWAGRGFTADGSTQIDSTTTSLHSLDANAVVGQLLTLRGVWVPNQGLLMNKIKNFERLSGHKVIDSKLWNDERARARKMDPLFKEKELAELAKARPIALPSPSGLPAPAREAVEQIQKSQRELVKSLEEAIGSRMLKALDPKLDKALIYEERGVTQRRVARSVKLLQTGLTASMFVGPLGGVVAKKVGGELATRAAFSFAVRAGVSSGTALAAYGLSASGHDEYLADRTNDRIGKYIGPELGWTLRKITKKERLILKDAAPVPHSIRRLQDIVVKLDPQYEPLPMTLD